MINFSSIDKFLQCEYAWALRYKEKLVPKKQFSAPLLGSAAHAGIAAGMHARLVAADQEEWSTRAALEYIADARKLVEEMADEETLAEYDAAAAKAPILAMRALRLFPAEEFSTIVHNNKPIIEYGMITRSPRAKAHIDWACREYNTGFHWIVDWKFRGEIQAPEGEDYDVQAIVYQRMFREVCEVVGTMNVQIAADLPSQPKTNKDGSMSRAAIRTDWATYEAALLAAGLNPDDYSDMREKLEKVRFSLVVPTPRSPENVDAVWNNVLIPALRSQKSKRTFLRSMSKFNCKRCSYSMLCLARMRGEDSEWLQNEHFQRKED